MTINHTVIRSGDSKYTCKHCGKVLRGWSEAMDHWRDTLKTHFNFTRLHIYTIKAKDV